RLTDVEVARTEGHDRVDQRSDPLRHESLQHMAFDRQPQAGHACNPRGVASNCDADALGLEKSPRSFHPDHTPVLDAKAGDLAVLDDVDAALIRPAREAPGDGVVAHRAAAPLKQAALDGKTRVIK